MSNSQPVSGGCKLRDHSCLTEGMRLPCLAQRVEAVVIEADETEARHACMRLQPRHGE